MSKKNLFDLIDEPDNISGDIAPGRPATDTARVEGLVRQAISADTSAAPAKKRPVRRRFMIGLVAAVVSAAVIGGAVAVVAQNGEQFTNEEQAYLAEFKEAAFDADKNDEYRSEAINLSIEAGYLDDSFNIEKLKAIDKKSWLGNENDAEYNESLKGFCRFITALCNTYADKGADLNVRDKMLLYYEIDQYYLQLSLRVKDNTVKEYTETKTLVNSTIKNENDH